MNLETQLIHAGEEEKKYEGAVALPIFQSATFAYSSEDSYHDIKYLRLNNTPNHTVVHEKLAQIAGGEAAVVTASGMAAITTALLTVLKKGDHLLAQNCLYGGTRVFLARDIADFGIDVDFVSGNTPDEWKKLVRPETRAIYVETMSNPLLEVADLPSVVAFAQSHNLISMIDNTFASPVNFRPLDIGFDLSLHSCTKYLNGHSDIVAGCAIGSRRTDHPHHASSEYHGRLPGSTRLLSLIARHENTRPAHGKTKRKRTRIGFFFRKSPGRRTRKLPGLIQPSATQLCPKSYLRDVAGY